MRTVYPGIGERFLTWTTLLLVAIFAGTTVSAAAEVTLEDALAAPASDLARAYIAASQMLNNILPAAEQGVTIHSPEGTITKENAASFRTRFENRLAIYKDAIQQRGNFTLAASYRLVSVSKSCSKSRSDWASLVAGKEFIDLQISQAGFEGDMNSRFNIEGSVKSFAMPIVVVETAIYFVDFLNSDYGWSGSVSEAGMEVWPLPDVVDSWPKWASPPKKKDLKNCVISFVPGLVDDPMN